MIVLTEGHKYLLEHFEKTEGFISTGICDRWNGQVIQFIEKAPVEEGSSELKTINNGTTNEEVIEMLINRITFLNNKFPSRENSIVITKLEEVLMWLEKRTKDRLKRGVEGKNIK